MLASGAVSLFGAHRELSQLLAVSSSSSESTILALLRFPLALHATWLTAASLLNLNAWAVISAISLPKQLALANASAYAAALLGATYSLRSGDPFVGPKLY
jgi:hypothetical protein